MVHTVQAPQRGHCVEQDMLKVDGQVEQDYRDEDRHPGRQRQDVENSPAMSLARQRHGDGGTRSHQPQDPGIQNDQSEVVRPALRAAEPQRPLRRKHFPQRNEDEYAQERTEAQHRLDHGQRIAHRRPSLGVGQR